MDSEAILLEVFDLCLAFEISSSVCQMCPCCMYVCLPCLPLLWIGSVLRLFAFLLFDLSLSLSLSLALSRGCGMELGLGLGMVMGMGMEIVLDTLRLESPNIGWECVRPISKKKWVDIRS